jgi:hypothetical protein
MTTKETIKMSSLQYRVTVNGAESTISSEYPGEKWERIANVWEERGGITAKLERRLITDSSILSLVNPEGYIQLGATVACPWETLASLEREND